MCLSACMHGKRWVSVMMAVVDSFWQAWKRVGQCNDGVVDSFGTHGKGWVSVMMGVVDSFGMHGKGWVSVMMGGYGFLFCMHGKGG